jgi:GntR family transcriptional regulator
MGWCRLLSVSVNARLLARAPKYYLVKLHLLEYIESLEQGAAVPAERDLAADLGTSRTTVRQALVELVAEGRLVRRQGSGTYVADAKITWPLQLASFTEQAAANGQVPSSELLGVERIPATAELAEKLGTRVGAGLHQLDRLRLADGRPTAVETALLSAARFPYLGRKMRSAGSLEALLANDYGVQLRGGEATIDTMPASPREAALLAVDTGSPMLVVRRRSFDTEGAPVEWATSWFRGDRITLVADLLMPGR